MIKAENIKVYGKDFLLVKNTAYERQATFTEEVEKVDKDGEKVTELQKVTCPEFSCLPFLFSDYDMDDLCTINYKNFVGLKETDKDDPDLHEKIAKESETTSENKQCYITDRNTFNLILRGTDSMVVSLHYQDHTRIVGLLILDSRENEERVYADRIKVLNALGKKASQIRKESDK